MNKRGIEKENKRKRYKETIEKEGKNRVNT